MFTSEYDIEIPLDLTLQQGLALRDVHGTYNTRLDPTRLTMARCISQCNSSRIAASGLIDAPQR